MASIATHGSRQAFFPNRRRSPLVHAVFGILFLGVCPLAIQIGSQKLFFVSPRLDDLRLGLEMFGDVCRKASESMWSMNQVLAVLTTMGGPEFSEKAVLKTLGNLLGSK